MPASPDTALRYTGDQPSELRVLFVCGYDFSVASEKQARWFAERLVERGHAAAISIGGDPLTAEREGWATTAGLALLRHRFIGRWLRRSDLAAARRFRPNVIHAFNPRLSVIAATAEYESATEAPVFVHWEDDEWTLRHDPMTRSLYRRIGRQARRLLASTYPPHGHFATASSVGWAVEQAAGFDALTPALAEAVSARLGRDCKVVLPVNPDAVSIDDPSDDGTEITVERRPFALMTGTIHKASEPELRIALRAIAAVQAGGQDIAFLHAGTVLPRFDPPRMAAEAGVRPGSARFLGYVPFERIPGLLRRATVLLQPGIPNEFNRLRLPSKLQAYLASGTPTITFAIGFGELLAEGEEVLKTYTGEPAELAGRIVDLLEDDDLRRRIGAGARAAAARLFDAERNTDALVSYYRAGIAAVSARAA